MPLASLKALAKHHPDLQQHLPADDAEEAVQRRSRRRHHVFYMPLATAHERASCLPLSSQPSPLAPCTLRLRGLVVALLPRFSMACVTEEEAAAAAKRREELEAIRKQREQLAAEEAEEPEEPVEEAEEAQAGQQPSAAPGAGQPADDKREARRDQADRDASGVLV